ncbi:hypothetical protein ABG067_002140 [Albugo candida]
MLFLSLVMQSWLMYPTSSDLIHLVSLSRHGNRAPNPIVQHLCPNNMQNYQAYHTPPEQLTERGMKQLQQAGEHIREVYVNQKRFLNVSFNGPHHQHFETYFRADAATRCGQSAAALGYGLYPDGSGPGEFKKQPLPIFMQLPENEHDFGAGGPCWQVSNQHLAKYARTRGHDLILKHQMMLQQVALICGADFYISKDPILAIKDVADMFLFDLNQGLPLLPGMNEDLLVELNSLSFQHMIERLYTTPREITYACGGFPLVMLRDLQHAAKLSSENRNTAMSFKYHSYHGHRELLHGLGFMMGLKFNFDGLLSYNGSTPLIPGTTLFIELHTKQEHKTDPYFVKLGHDLILKHQMMLQQVALICGADFYISKDPILAIKDVADMFLFDLNQGLPLLPGMNEDLLVELNSLSFQHMIERLYTTPREITYACGGFPLVMLRDLQHAAKLSSENRNTAMSFKYHSYHGHRELLHGLGFMMGLKFNFDGLLSYNGSTPLIPGTTLFIELHTKQEHKTDPYFVKLYVWTPETKRTLLKLHQCPHECPLSNFTTLITSFIVSTGTWEDICHYHPQVLDVAIMSSEVRRYLPTFTDLDDFHSTVSDPSNTTSTSVNADEMKKKQRKRYIDSIERVQWLHHQDIIDSDSVRRSRYQTDEECSNLTVKSLIDHGKLPPHISQDTLNTSSADDNLSLDDLRSSMSDSVIAQIHTAREYDMCTVMKGWMEKCGQQLKAWNWQYFVLRDDGVLSFYVDEGMKKLKGTLNVGHDSGAQVSVQLNLTEKRHVFLLSTSVRATLFSTPSRKVMNQWIAGLKSVGVGTLEQIDLSRNTVPYLIRDKDTPHHWQNLHQSDELIRRDGFLWKRGHLKKNWKKRFFRVENGQLQYFTENRKLMRGAIALNGTVVSPGMTCCPDGRKNYFVISNMSHTKELHLNAETETEMHEWIEALQRAQCGFGRQKTIEEPTGFALVVKRAEEIPMISFYATYSKSSEIDIVMERKTEAVVVTACPGKSIPIGSQLVGVNDKNILSFTKSSEIDIVMERKTEAVVVTACPGKSIPIGSQLVGVNDKNILSFTYVESRDLLQTSHFPLTLYFIAPPFKMGSMIKKSRSGLENWKERVIVVSNGEIRYYKKTQKANRDSSMDVSALKPRKAFTLYGCYMNLINVPDRQHCIVIVRSPNDKLVLQASNQEECMEWASIIYCSIRISSQGITQGHSKNLQLEKLLEVSMEDTSRCSLQSNSTIEV